MVAHSKRLLKSGGFISACFINDIQNIKIILLLGKNAKRILENISHCSCLSICWFGHWIIYCALVHGLILDCLCRLFLINAILNTSRFSVYCLITGFPFVKQGQCDFFSLSRVLLEFFLKKVSTFGISGKKECIFWRMDKK